MVMHLLHSNIKSNHKKVLQIIKSLDFDEIEWLYECCFLIVNKLEIQEIDNINSFFRKKGCKPKNKFDLIKKRINFADEKWFIYQIFSEYQKRGGIVTGKEYESIKKL